MLETFVFEEYCWVIGVAAVMCLQVLLQGFYIGSARRRFFTREFFEKNFESLNYTDHKGGYPDMGSGKFAQKLSVQDWITFASVQRAHQNYVEGVCSIVALTLFSGLFNAGFAFVFGALYIVGRAFYAIGYRSKGPKGRLFGAILLDLSLLALFIHVVYNVFTVGGGVKGATNLLQSFINSCKQCSLVTKYFN
mmetsp:Transcript_9652/g.14532  ORF Transcript_9652/g.14532 Transcript_9652/m.14532 type:complete len:193 (-) Transcript_9652:114-692(-)